MIGIDQATGKHLSGIDHLRQSIRDILRTKVGERVMRREYGSRVPDIVDRPMTRENIIELYANVGESLARWEPRFRLSQVRIVSASDAGQIELELTGIYLVDNRAITLQGIIL